MALTFVPAVFGTDAAPAPALLRGAATQAPPAAAGSLVTPSMAMLVCGAVAVGKRSRKTTGTARRFFGGSAAPAPKEIKSYKDFSDPWLGSADMGFDPLGIGSWDVLNINFLREAEIKHGRVAMLGFAGIMVEAAGIKAPGVEATFGPSTDIFEIHNAAVAKVPLPRLLHAHTRVGTVFYTCKECRVGNPETRNTSRAGLDRWCMVPAAVILNPTL